MTPPPDDLFPPPEPGLDAAVRGHLDTEAARTDPAAVWDALSRRLAADAAPPAVPSRPRRLRRWALGAVAVAALAAAVLVAVSVVPPTRQAAASPADVVEAARAAHAAPVDRCYAVTVELPPGTGLGVSGRRGTLCTRGDRCVVTPGFGRAGAWGRDGTGRVWIAPTRAAAARFDEAELPPVLRDRVKITGLELPTLLDDVLKNYDLTWADPPSPAAAAYDVTATRRGPTPPFGLAAAGITVERGTDVVTALVLHRPLPGGGEARIAYTLEPTGTAAGEAAYAAEGHLDPGAPVYDRDRPLPRGRVIARVLAEILANGL